MMMRNRINLKILTKFILILTIIICVLNCISAYKVAKVFQNNLITQYETGYLNYLNNDRNILEDYEKESLEPMIKDSINLYNRAKIDANNLSISDNEIYLDLEITSSLIITLPFNSVYMEFSFKEIANINKDMYIIGDKGNYNIKLSEKKGSWETVYVKRYIKKPYKYA